MKRARWMVVFIIMIFIIVVPFTTFAIDTELVTQPLSDKEVVNIVKQREFEKITSYTPVPVKCFDVRDDHMVVIGADVGDAAIIAVYDDSGAFQYGFQTKEPGSFRVMWSGDDIVYYSIRSAFLFKINEDGKITDICRVANTAENSIYDQDVLLSTTRKVGTVTYSITNESAAIDKLSASFKKIIKTDTEGVAIIYDASSNQYVSFIAGVVVFLISSSIIVSGCIVGIKRHRNNTGDG